MNMNVQVINSEKRMMPAFQDLNAALEAIGPLPEEALFLGMASDRLPVLLNLQDPVPGPMLITGDAGSGKTAFLQMVAAAAGRKFQPEALQFAVITDHPEQWRALELIPNMVGIFAMQDPSASDLILSLASWAHANKTSKQSVLLMVDDLESAAHMNIEMVQNFRWLLLRGPARRVWPLITLNANHYGQVLAWIEMFHNRVYGRIENPQIAGALGADPSSAANQLEPCRQFVLREHGQWLRFTIPGLD